MNIIVSDLTYHYPNQQPLFEHLNFSAGPQEKVSIAGSNGAGKSTLLQLMAGMLKPSGGSVAADSEPYYIPQHTGASGKSVAELMRVSEKLAALDAIVKGSVRQPDYDTLADDWEIESRCRAALSYWQVPHITPGMAADNLSGGERTKVLLAGLLIHTPGIILMDEPTNHIDREGRELLYRYIHQSRATMVIVSHDIILLDRLPATCELSAHGIRQYGGNYSFYKEQKEIEAGALSDSIHEEEKALRLAKRQAQEMRQRQERRANHAEKKKEQGGMPRIMLNALGGAAENTAARLNGRHAGIISSSRDKLAALRLQEDRLNGLKIDFDHAQLHPGKLLIEARGVNFAWPQGDMLWDTPLDMKLFGNDRIHVTGSNGTGKTTFVNLLTGVLSPSAGEVRQAGFSWIYLDQNYTQADVDCTVEQLAGKHNTQHLEEHELKIRLNRFMFSADTWDKNCRALSGGEKMRLCLCCLMIANQTPDLIVLDEPANNLDTASLQILTQTVRNYKGSLLVISHDSHFVNETGITAEFALPLRKPG
jgi:ATPase subunit of ABC transporter with duplicated ATPase domains